MTNKTKEVKKTEDKTIVKVQQEGVKIIIDYGTVWAFMWRWIVIVLGIYASIFILGLIFGLLA